MNFHGRLSNFSALELAVAVAILATLASIAVPAFNVHVAKARQSEAKAELSSLYAAEKVFHAEFKTYESRFESVGYAPQGRLRYNVGFAGADHATTARYCGLDGAVQHGCSLLRGADHAPVSDASIPAGTNLTATSFTAGAGAVLRAGMTDQWTIDSDKKQTNTQDGVEDYICTGPCC